MWNLWKPEPLCGPGEPLKLEPVCGTLGNLNFSEWNLYAGARFPAAAPNHPEALLEEPQAFRAAAGKKRVRTEIESLPQQGQMFIQSFQVSNRTQYVPNTKDIWT